MYKLNKKDYINLIILLIIFFSIAFLITGKGNLYGSTTDWSNQHIPFADYFRTLFYETKSLFPDFSLSIGAGQNIYNFAYYGLLNPIILFSYLLPMIDMTTYVIASTLIITALGIVLLYKWLKNNGYTTSICFYTSFIYICAAPIVFHTHRHIMFINYLPFLIMGLIGIDKYFKDKKISLIILSVFLMIMTSYFYSVTGLVALAVYATYKYLNKNKFKLKSFLILVRNLLFPVFIGILASSILLLPLIYVLSQGRMGININYTFLDFLPQARIDFLLYSPYSLGLTSVAIIALINSLISEKKSIRFLGIIFAVLIFCPIIVYLFNGTLYINSKVLIPFLPIIMIIIAELFKDVIKGKNNFKGFLIALLMIILFLLITNRNTEDFPLILYIAFFLDLFVTSLCYLLSFITKNKFIFFIPVMVLSLIIVSIVNYEEAFVKKDDFMKVNSKAKKELIKKTIKDDKEFYRFSDATSNYNSVNKVYDKNYYTTSIYSSTYNNDYNDFYFKIFENETPFRNKGIIYTTKNSLFDILMGVKYKVGFKNNSYFYKKIDKNKSVKLYENDYAFPIGYATSNIISDKDFNKLSYPYNVDATLNNVISKYDKTNTDFISKVEKLNWNIEDFDIKSKNGKVKFKTKKPEKFELDLPEELNNKVLFLSFSMNKSQDCKIGDTHIAINGIKNKLTCKSWRYHNNNYRFNYVISKKNKLKKLKISTSPGEFDLSDFTFYTLDINYVKSLKNNVDPLIVDRKDIKSNGFKGKINVKKDGMFVLTIPHDKGFNIKVDGQEVEYKEVNKSFIGFDIKRGKHKVEIYYTSPLKKEGVCLSIFALSVFVIIIIVERKNLNNKKKEK